MPNKFSHGVYKPQKVELVWASAAQAPQKAFPAVVAIERLQTGCGATPGTAEISYPSEYAKDAVPVPEAPCYLIADNEVLFRGLVVNAPFEIDIANDTLRLELVDDRWLLASKIVGQGRCGTQGEPAGTNGWKDVAFDPIFNKDGIPNKDPAALDFLLGTTAVAWTLQDIARWLFHATHVDVAKITLDYEAELAGAGWDYAPKHLSLIGQTIAQALDTLTAMAGETWTLRPGEEVSTYASVKRGGNGTTRTFTLAEPKGGSRVTSADAYYADSCRVARDIVSVRDTHQVFSGPTIKEYTYSNKGDDPLLVLRSAAKDKKFQYCLGVDVTKYAIHSLGAARAGTNAKPKPWLPHLVTRKWADGSTYLLAGQLAEYDTLLNNDTLMEPLLWYAPDGDAANSYLVTGGYRIDARNCLLWIEHRIEVAANAFDGKEGTMTLDLSGAGRIWLTVATELETRRHAETQMVGMLTNPMYAVIQKPDLVPELRHLVWLPDLDSTDRNAHIIAATPDEETYVDIYNKIVLLSEAAALATPEIETHVEVTLPWLAVARVGDKLAITGRNLTLSGYEVITDISWQIYETYRMTIEATNVPARRSVE